jgi:hypothetical protein
MPNHISTIQLFIFPLSTSGPAGFYCMYIVRNVHTPSIFMDSSYVLYVPAIYFLSLYLFVALRPCILHTNFVNNLNNPYMYCTERQGAPSPCRHELGKKRQGHFCTLPIFANRWPPGFWHTRCSQPIVLPMPH